MFRLSETAPKKIKVDVKDKKILVLLADNSRMPITELSRKVQLSRDTATYRINRLEKLGIIQGFYPEIDFKKLGYNVYRVLFLISESNKQKQKDFIEALINHPNTLNVIEYSDRWDVELILIAKNIEMFDSIVTDITAKFSSIIMEKTKLAIISTYYSILFPFTEHGRSTPMIESQYTPDKKDLQILKMLAKDSRQSTYEIAKHVDLSADAIGLRIKRLVREGIITKFTILPNLSLLGYSWYTFAVRMKIFDKYAESKFKTFVKDHPNIIKAVKTLGVWDLLLFIIADSPKDYHNTIKQIKNEFAAILNDYDAWVAYRECCFNPMPKILNQSA
jgi:Lrp/AsnC family transcriptional regulator for asnA, asnC and gidA